MTEIKDTDGAKMMSMKDKIKREAENQVNEEKFQAAKNKLVDLYRKREAARKVVKNIDNEIADYEMEIEEK